MEIRKILHTVRHLRARQIIHQLIYRLHRPALKLIVSPPVEECVMVSPIEKLKSLDAAGDYTFLNIRHTPPSWNDASKGMLWAYNLNYMDYLLQPELSTDESLGLIEKFIDDLPENKVGLDPYPIALRGINWIKWMSAHASEIKDDTGKKINDSLYSQYRLLEEKLEFHLLGNHLLEDAYSLAIAAIYFNEKRMWHKATKLLRKQLDEQILADGAHYEQSPMYHCILLDRLLDVINVSTNNPRFGESQTELDAFLKDKAALMLGHLDSIVWKDGSIPLLNDSAYDIAPAPEEIKDYARRLRMSWIAIPLKECGYRKFDSGRIEAIMDIGNIAASYQPGHSHADTFNYELRIDGHPFVVDTGISTYDKTPRRQYERSTRAHNTMVIDGKDSSEVWGGFRVGHRAEVMLTFDREDEVVASHNGFKNSIHRRRFLMDDGIFSVTDNVKGRGVSLIHLAPDVRIESVDNSVIKTDSATIEIEQAAAVRIAVEKASTEYNRFRNINVIEIEFDNRMTYKIIPNL